MTAPEVREPRSVVVVDCESTGLDPTRHVALEVAWVNASTGEWGRFLPYVDPHDLQRAEPRALEINGYVTRLAAQPKDDGTEAVRLHRQLRGSVLAGSNPSFDAALLGPLFVAADRECLFDQGELGHPGPSRPMRLREPWHHRKLDLSCWAAAALGLPASELPGLSRTCELLELTVIPDHTAMGDVLATLACLRALGAIPGTEAAVGGAA